MFKKKSSKKIFLDKFQLLLEVRSVEVSLHNLHFYLNIMEQSFILTCVCIYKEPLSLELQHLIFLLKFPPWEEGESAPLQINVMTEFFCLLTSISISLVSH